MALQVSPQWGGAEQRQDHQDCRGWGGVHRRQNLGEESPLTSACCVYTSLPPRLCWPPPPSPAPDRDPCPYR